MAKFALKTALPGYLRDEQRRIEGFARAYGLDFFPTVFEMLSYDQMNEVAAYGGFPTRYPHWRFGMEYEQLSKSYEYGLSKIYEMVINNNPSIAYLLEGNSLVEQKLVMAHVYAHVDFFKNNFAFHTTNQGSDPRTGEPIRKWIDTMANHGAIARRWANRVGIERVEEFIDVCLSLENLIDPQKPFVPPPKRRDEEEKPEDAPAEETPRLRVDKDYMESFINPDEFVAKQKKKLDAEKEKAKRHPERPDRDILGFLVENGPLERWERDILQIVRRESYYFLPQMQTKVMNEGWACVRGDTPVFTDMGLVSMREVVTRRSGVVADGSVPQRVYDTNVVADQPTVEIRTRRGLVLCGSENHRVLLSDGETWRRLDQLQVGDRLRVAGGSGLWPMRPVSIEWVPPSRVSLDDVAAAAGVSVSTVIRHRAGTHKSRTPAAIDEALVAYESSANTSLPQTLIKRKAITIPKVVDEELATFLGYLIGDGHISRVKREVGLTTGDDEQADAFAGLCVTLFGVTPRKRRDGNRWRVLASAEMLSDFLVERFGLTHGPSANRKRIPDAVLRSPARVVRAFLRAYFDCDGYAGKQGVILSTTSNALAEQTQLLLLNFGILSRRRRQNDGCWHVHVMGASAARFADVVGFNLQRKQRALESYVRERQWFRQEVWDDEVVSLSSGRGDVYDISVENTHRYVASGLVNHNSFWHSKIMTEKACDASEIIDYADRNAGVMATAPGRLNPYKLGVELYRHVEERWNRGQFGKEWDDCDDIVARRHWDRRLGLGMGKILEVRKHYTDVTFIDEFLTPDFVMEQKMYSFGFNPRNDRWEIESRKFKEVKERLLHSLTNAGQPFIYVKDANHQNRGELLLWHDHQGIDLRLDYARDVLRGMVRIWRRPVEIHSIVEGKPTLLRFDGNEHVQRPMK